MVKSLVIFDLDGTLVDSKSDLCTAVNFVRREFGLERLDPTEITPMVGDGARALVARATGLKHDEIQLDRAHRMFLDYYGDHMLDETELYAGVRETLDQLVDCELAVLTNKPYGFSRRMLLGLDVYDRFSSVYGGNSFEQKKPDPIGVFTIIAETGADPAVTWVVGDSSVDVLTGRNAGVRTCGVTYGYGVHTFDADPPDHLIDAMIELPPLVLA